MTTAPRPMRRQPWSTRPSACRPAIQDQKSRWRSDNPAAVSGYGVLITKYNMSLSGKAGRAARAGEPPTVWLGTMVNPRLLRQQMGDELRRQIGLQAFAATLGTIAAFVDAAERRLGQGHRKMINAHHAGRQVPAQMCRSAGR